MPAMSPAARVAAVALLAAVGAVACGRSREQRALAAQREQVHQLAQQAAQLATADTTAGATADSASARRAPPESSPVGRATIPNKIGLPQVAGVAPDSMHITSTDGAVVYTLARDTVRMPLSDSLVRAVRQKVNADADTTSGNFSGFIKHTVAGALGSAMGFVVKTPVRDIRSATYDNGDLRIESSGGPLHRGTFSVGNKRDGKDHTTFARADAERFVAAIEARQRALGVR